MLQEYLNKIVQNFTVWQLKIIINKCEGIHLGFNNMMINYEINKIIVPTTRRCRELGIKVSEGAKFRNFGLKHFRLTFSCKDVDFKLHTSDRFRNTVSLYGLLICYLLTPSIFWPLVPFNPFNPLTHSTLRPLWLFEGSKGSGPLWPYIVAGVHLSPKLRSCRRQRTQIWVLAPKASSRTAEKLLSQFTHEPYELFVM